LRRLKESGFDLYRRVPAELTVGTTKGGLLSATAAVILVLLVIFEWLSYQRTTYTTSVFLDRHEDAMMAIHFNVSVHRLPCSHVDIETSDLLGLHAVHRIRHIHKVRLLDDHHRMQAYYAPSDSYIQPGNGTRRLETRSSASHNNNDGPVNVVGLDGGLFKQDELSHHVDASTTSRNLKNSMSSMGISSLDWAEEGDEATLSAWEEKDRSAEQEEEGTIASQTLSQSGLGGSLGAVALHRDGTLDRSDVVEALGRVEDAEGEVRLDAGEPEQGKEDRTKVVGRRKRKKMNSNAVIQALVDVQAHQESDSREISTHGFRSFIQSHDLVLVNFYAPWCFWSQQLMPIWDQLADQVRSAGYEEQVAVARVDCTDPRDRILCYRADIHAFPTIQVYSHRSTRRFSSYRGERSALALNALLQRNLRSIRKSRGFEEPEESPDDGLADSKWAAREEEIKQQFYERRRLQMSEKDQEAVSGAWNSDSLAEGCELSGYVLVHKAPGSLTINPVSPTTASISSSSGNLNSRHSGVSFQHDRVNMSHTVHQWTFGTRMSKRMLHTLPTDKQRELTALEKKRFVTVPQQPPLRPAATSYEHYIKVVPTEFRNRRLTEVLTGLVSHSGGDGVALTAGTYSVITSRPQEPDPPSDVKTTSTLENQIGNENEAPPHTLPAIRWIYDISPMHVLVVEKKKPFASFVVSVCAIVGGVFTVIGLLDSVIDKTMESLGKKLD